jgi:PST family polysaccharide transporter
MTSQRSSTPSPVQASLRKKAVAGMFWSVATGVGSRVMSLASTLIVTRYVDPKAYGEVSVAYVVTQLASLAASLGVGQYVSTRPKATRSELFHAAWVFHGAGLVALALVYLFRAPLGPVFGAEHIEGYILGYIAATFFERVALIPESVLIRDMRFRTSGLIGTAAELSYSVLVLVLAARGFGGDAIVYAAIARCALRAGLGLWATDVREWTTPHPLDRGVVREILRYGLPITGARLSSIIARRGDNLAFSTLFGPARMGAYNLAYNLADVPATTVGERIGDVLVPSFAKLEEKDRPGALVRSISFVGFAVFPLAALLAGISRPLTLFLNDKWQALDVRWMLAVLSLLSVARPIEWSVRVYLQVAARTRLIMIIEWAKVVVLMAAIFGLGQLGPIWACIAVGVTFLLSGTAYLFAASRVAGVALGRLLGALLRPIACSAFTAAAMVVLDRFVIPAIVKASMPGETGVHVIDRYLLPHWGAAAGLTLDLPVGVLIYAGAAYLVAREQMMELVRRLRDSRTKKVAAAA